MRPISYRQLLDALLVLTPEQLDMTACVILEDGLALDLYDHFTVDMSPDYLRDEMETCFDDPNQPLLSTFLVT
jgi:hypothetical protein